MPDPPHLSFGQGAHVAVPARSSGGSSSSPLARVASQTGFESSDAKKQRTEDARMDVSEDESEGLPSLVSDDWESDA